MSLFRPKEYIRAVTVDEATAQLIKYGELAVVLAGGTDLLVAKPQHVKYIVDISRLPLSYIKDDEKGITIGALTTLSDVESSSKLSNEPYNVVSKSASEIGTPLTKNFSTIGGNVCNAAPSADMAPSLIALDAEARIKGPSGERTVPMADFFTGPKTTVLGKGEILIEIFVPKAPAKTQVAFLKKGRTSEDIAQVNAAVRVTLGTDGSCTTAKIVLGAVAPTPMRAKGAEAMLHGKKPNDISQMAERVAKKASDETKPISDIRASAEYRKGISEVFVKRALMSVIKKLGG